MNKRGVHFRVCSPSWLRSFSSAIIPEKRGKVWRAPRRYTIQCTWNYYCIRYFFWPSTLFRVGSRVAVGSRHGLNIPETEGAGCQELSVRVSGSPARNGCRNGTKSDGSLLEKKKKKKGKKPLGKTWEEKVRTKKSGTKHGNVVPSCAGAGSHVHKKASHPTSSAFQN